MAVISWNASLLDETERTKYIRSAVDAIVDMAGQEWRNDAERMFKVLIARKEQYFGKDKRYIADYHITETGSEYRLSVASFTND